MKWSPHCPQRQRHVTLLPREVRAERGSQGEAQKPQETESVRETHTRACTRRDVDRQIHTQGRERELIGRVGGAGLRRK